ncbi:hypothetical protein lbkm_2169 [Lachnospiraceae bacterium KM106-2]|nr:hypothetical protein lbkm_2169 [Lachnospiraceae bacterium KM106-2]
MVTIIRELKVATENHMNNFVVDYSEKIESGIHDTFNRIGDRSNTAD